MVSVVKELTLRITVEEAYFLEVISLLQEINHSCDMICEELHVYKKQPAPIEKKKGKGAKGKKAPEVEESKDDIAQEGVPKI